MRLNAYSLFDTKSLQYHLPFFLPTDAAAIRSVSDLVDDPSTGVGRHPADYVLFCVGLYDDNVGAMVPVSPLRHVIDAVALVKATADLFPFPPKKESA